MMRKIRIAQIGTSNNSHGNDIFGTLRRFRDLFEVVGYALPENERKKFPNRMPIFEGVKEMTVEEILNDPTIEAVAVETEEIYLTKYALMVAKSGKHMHMEKPGSPDLAAFEELVKTVKENGTVFHIGYMYRYNPNVIDLMKQVKNGEIGDVISVEAQMNCTHPKEVRRWLGAFPGGMLYFLGCHLIDLILQIQGEPENIIPLSRNSGLGNGLGDDFGMAVFEYKNGVSFAKTTAVEFGGFARRQLVVSGSRKTVEIKPLEWYEEKGIFSGKTEYSVDGWHDSGVASRTETYGRYDAMMQGFARMVRGEIANPYTYDYELILYKTLLRACGAI